MSSPITEMRLGVSNQIVWLGVNPNTPLGAIWVGLSEDGLVAVDLQPDMEGIRRAVARFGYRNLVQDNRRVQLILDQIGAYLAGERTNFDIPINWLVLTPFQERVLRATWEVPYGHTVTYGEIAQRINQPRAARAVGRAEATNPMPLVIPCHRVLGADGGLHGYGAAEGLKTKAWLLRLEAETLARLAG